MTLNLFEWLHFGNNNKNNNNYYYYNYYNYYNYYYNYNCIWHIIFNHLETRF